MTRRARHGDERFASRRWSFFALALAGLLVATLSPSPARSDAREPAAAAPDCHRAASPPSQGTATPDVGVSVVRISEGRKKQSDRFPNVELLTQHEKPVCFYDDLVKDRIVIVNFMYTTCSNICLPIAQNLGRVHERLGDRMGREILILSLTIDSKVDDPAALRKYIERNGGEKEGWVYLTGDYDDIDRSESMISIR